MSLDLNNFTISHNATHKQEAPQSLNKVGFLYKLFVPVIAVSTMVIAMTLNGVVDKVKTISLSAKESMSLVEKVKIEQDAINMQVFSNEAEITKRMETQQIQMFQQQQQIFKQSELIKDFEKKLLEQTLLLKEMNKKVADIAKTKKIEVVKADNNIIF